MCAPTRPPANQPAAPSAAARDRRIISIPAKTGAAAPRARLAIDLYVYRIGRELGSLAAALGGLDAIVFTGGIGENSAEIRERVCRDARWLGVTLDEQANRNGGPRIDPGKGAVSSWVVPTNEELMIARHTRRVLQG